MVIHADIEMKCAVCGHQEMFFAEAGVEEDSNGNLKEKSRLTDQKIPCMIECPRCHNLTMHEHGFYGWPHMKEKTRSKANAFARDNGAEFAKVIYRGEEYEHIERDWH